MSQRRIRRPSGRNDSPTTRRTLSPKYTGQSLRKLKAYVNLPVQEHSDTEDGDGSIINSDMQEGKPAVTTRYQLSTYRTRRSVVNVNYHNVLILLEH